MIGLLAAAALAAAPLRVEVELWEPPGRPRPQARPAPGTVPAPEAEVVADGVREAAWEAVPPAPPLLPLVLGGTPPEVDLRVARAGSAVVLLAPRPAAGWTTTVVLDPDGTATTWWAVRVRADAGRGEACGLSGLDFARPVIVPPRAAPCAPTDAVRVALGEGVVEVALPAAGLTAQARLLVATEGPRAQGGTWSHLGLADARPELGRRLGLPALPAQVDRAVDPVAGVHRLTITPGARARGPWTWERRARGRLVAAGELAVEGGVPVVLELPLVGEPQGVVELRDPRSGPPPATVVVPLSDPEARAWLRTPVHGDVLELGWVAPGPMPGLRLWLEDARGRVVGEAVVDLPAGNGLLRVGRPSRGRVARVKLDVLAPDGLPTEPAP